MSEVFLATRLSTRMGSATVVLLAANLTIMPMDCDQVRSFVMQYGKARATVWAIEQITLGTYSWKEMRAAKRCLDASKGRS